MAPEETKLFLKEVDKIKWKIKWREDINDIIQTYQDITQTKKNIINTFFPNVWEKERSKYMRALQDIVKESIGQELFQELRRKKSIYHGKKTDWLAGGNYYNNLIIEKWEEEVKRIYTDNAKKWVEAKWLIPRTEEEKQYILDKKAEWIMTNQQIADGCNTQFRNSNNWLRNWNSVAQWYYKYNNKNKKQSFSNEESL